MMLTELRRATESYLDCPVRKAVVTVPAHFDLSQIQATVDAAEIAGIQVLRTVGEPTAAAVAYGYAHGAFRGLTAVYDLGGGTFDFSVLELGDGVYEVKAVSGDNRLGGEDFDHLLVTFLVERILQEHGVDLTSDTLALHRLKEAAEQIKIDLDSCASTSRSLPYLTTSSGDLFTAELKVSRAELEQLFDDLISRTLAPCSKALADGGIERDSISRLVLVGGMSRMPAVRRRVAEFFDLPTKQHLDPSRIVAHGAAIQAGVLSGDCRFRSVSAWAPPSSTR
jgi:molecular chaperone DnaK